MSDFFIHFATFVLGGIAGVGAGWLYFHKPFAKIDERVEQLEEVWGRQAARYAELSGRIDALQTKGKPRRPKSSDAPKSGRGPGRPRKSAPAVVPAPETSPVATEPAAASAQLQLETVTHE